MERVKISVKFYDDYDEVNPLEQRSTLEFDINKEGDFDLIREMVMKEFPKLYDSTERKFIALNSLRFLHVE